MTAPNWRDLTPDPACNVTLDQYPEPRACAVADGVGVRHLGHPANCRLYADMVRRDPGSARP